MSSFIIAGGSSSTGKTTLTLGILRALKNRGVHVQPFKAGPDYIDPMFHRVAAGRPSYNLDTILFSEKVVRHLHYSHVKDAEIGVIEGVMGLYDGLGTEKDNGSTAHLAKVLDVPVILVINGSGMSSSAAAMVLGFKLYDPSVKLAGVILNRLGSQSHYALLKEAIERDTGVPCLGWLPNQESMVLESRHLGLIPVDELPEMEADLDRLAASIEEHVSLDALITLGAVEPPVCPEPVEVPNFDALKGMRMGIFKDKAFNFYYQDNIDLLTQQGVEWVEMSPLADGTLKPCDALYIGGGYPEMFTQELSANSTFRASLLEALENGLVAYAECGGFMYLTKAIDGVPMVGFFEDEALMTKKLQRFGYVDIQTESGLRTKAHEFHFSDVSHAEELPYAFKVSKPLNPSREWRCGRAKKNVIGSYPHIHFYSQPEIIKQLFRL